MNRVVLISCASRKANHAAKAADLYTSQLFRLSLQFTRKIQPQATFILSAKYGLVRPDKVIEPYDVTLKTMSLADVKAWSDRVYRQLQQQTNVENDHFIFPLVTDTGSTSRHASAL